MLSLSDALLLTALTMVVLVLLLHFFGGAPADGFCGDDSYASADAGNPYNVPLAGVMETVRIPGLRSW